MNEWLEQADEAELGEVATLATVMLTRVAELSAARGQSKAVIDRLEAGDVAGARRALAEALETWAELAAVAEAFEELARSGH